MKLFIDANILIDILTERKPFYTSATAFVTFCLENNYEMVTNTLCISNTYYLGQQIIRNQKITKKKIESINSFCKVEDMTQSQLDTSFQSGFVDFEDALHNACAIENQCTHIITRDKKGFKKSYLKVLTPTLFLTQYDS